MKVRWMRLFMPAGSEQMAGLAFKEYFPIFAPRNVLGS